MDPQAQSAEVELLVRGMRRRELSLGHSPNATGSSTAFDAFRLREARGEDERPLPMRAESDGWRIRARGASLRIVYEASWAVAQEHGRFTEEIRSSGDSEGARLFGYDVFLFPLRDRVESIRVRYELPSDWKLVHPFQTEPLAADYPDLRSLHHSVVAMGRLRTLSRNVAGCELVLAVRGRFRFGDHDLMDTIERVARHQLGFFGGGPRARYVFVVDEHRDTDDPRQLRYFGLHFDGSMSILLDPRTDRTRLESEPAHIIAHEFFHNWIGETVGQHRYDMNWFVEGMTTYYAYQTARAIGILDNGSYARALHQRFEDDYLDNGVRGRHSLAEAGTIVLQDPDVTRFLYAAGALAGLSLDEELGRLTRQRVDLDDVMRELVLRARHRGEPRWQLTREELEDVLLQLSGSDFRPWLERHVYGRDALPLPDYVVQAAR